MDSQDLDRRRQRARQERWVILQGEDGFRIYSLPGGGRPFVVTGSETDPHCTCPDFTKNEDDPGWRCKHILAVQERYAGSSATGEAVRDSIPPPTPALGGGVAETTPSGTHMHLKRSISPDGYINSLSVEFSCPVPSGDSERVTQDARDLLGIQESIVRAFLERGDTGEESPSADSPPAREGQAARIIRIGGTKGQYGRRLFFTIDSDAGPLRLYGSRKQLAAHLERAGYPSEANNIREGVKLNLPCRILTEPSKDSDFVNVTKVLPPSRIH